MAVVSGKYSGTFHPEAVMAVIWAGFIMQPAGAAGFGLLRADTVCTDDFEVWERRLQAFRAASNMFIVQANHTSHTRLSRTAVSFRRPRKPRSGLIQAI